MTHTVTSEIFKQSALWCILCQSRRASAVLWKGLVLLGNTLCDPTENVWQCWHREYVQVFFSKRKRTPDNSQALCQTHSPVSHSTGHFHPWNCFLGEGGITSAIVQGLNEAKPSQGHQHPVTALLGTRHHLERGVSSSHPFPSQALLLLLSLPPSVCCFSARAEQGSTIKFTFWIWQGFIQAAVLPQRSWAHITLPVPTARGRC